MMLLQFQYKTDMYKLVDEIFTYVGCIAYVMWMSGQVDMS